MLAFGIILLAIGLFAYFYREADYGYGTTTFMGWIYPYQTMGIILTIVGIILVVASFFARKLLG